ASAPEGLGRKRRTDIWKHFCYNLSERKTMCTVTEHGERHCGYKLGGKNTTNLKRHLKAHHPALYAASPEQISKEKMIAQWIARSGLPVRTVEDDAFIHMIESIDKRLAVPKKTKINNLVDQLYDDEKQKFRKQLTKVRKITLGLDIWTKRGLTASFLAISACYFCPQEEKAKHILLTLVQLSHPHTAECIKTCVDRCTEEWGIPKNKILTVITDNGSNMVTAFKKSEEYDDHSTTEEDSQEDSEEDSDDVEVEDQR
ncbi:putative zinc finger BED domain-containing protein 4-like, partial [Triplophysa rosa]